MRNVPVPGTGPVPSRHGLGGPVSAYACALEPRSDMAGAWHRACPRGTGVVPGTGRVAGGRA